MTSLFFPARAAHGTSRLSSSCTDRDKVDRRRSFVYMADDTLEEDKSKPGRACEGSRRDLIKCLRESDCVKVVCRGDGLMGGEGAEIATNYCQCLEKKKKISHQTLLTEPPL